MTTEQDSIALAQKDRSIRERLIMQHDKFIRQCASKSAGRFVDEHDDIYSEALIAFDTAITSYDKEKGEFFPFASKVIHNRIADYMRREQRDSKVVPFSSLITQNDHGDDQPFDAEDTNYPFSDGLIEVTSLQQELLKYGISVFDLPAASPKAEKSKVACKKIIRYVHSQPSLCQSILNSGVLPAKSLTEELGVPKKIFERHKKYILAGLLICEHDYALMQRYFQ